MSDMNPNRVRADDIAGTIRPWSSTNDVLSLSMKIYTELQIAQKRGEILGRLEVEKLQSAVDMYRDEFKRINACAGTNTEIQGLCARAINDTERRVSLCVENEKLIAENARLVREWDVCHKANEELVGQHLFDLRLKENLIVERDVLQQKIKDMRNCDNCAKSSCDNEYDVNADGLDVCWKAGKR